MNAKNLGIGVYVTAVLLAISVFLPLTSLPLIGDVSYNRVADIESYIVIAFCASAAGLLIIGQAKFTFVSAIGVWVTLLFPAIQGAFRSEDSGFLSKVTDKASSALSEFAADLFLNVTDFSWGGYIFLLALLGFTVTCVLRSFK